MRVEPPDTRECQSYLDEFMTQRGYTTEELARRAGLSPETITGVRTNRWKGIHKQTIERLCAALEIDVGQLLGLTPRDIWLPIRTSREVTIHFGSTTIPLGHAAERPVEFAPPFVSARDLRAFRRILDHLTSLPHGIKLRTSEHGAGQDVLANGSGRSIEEMFASGNHVVIGSPRSNALFELLVALLYGARPYKAEDRSLFPFAFAWKPDWTIPSAFGWAGKDNLVGIADTATGELVARRTAPGGDGVGLDCAMIVVATFFKPPVQREFRDDTTRTIICIGGHGALGTEGAARIATSPQYAAQLLPVGPDRRRMSIVSTTYVRPTTTDLSDNRRITDTSIVAAA